jgi:8-oxo-dGTP diphosphatase
MNMSELMLNTEPNKLPDSPADAVHVAVGVIFNSKQDQILIAKRPKHLHQGGLWEFPGGKVSSGETIEHALARELFEELGISDIQAEPLMHILYEYPDKKVYLDIWIIHQFSGQAQGKEGQQCEWVNLQNLLSSQSQYQFPAANQPILERLKIL